MRIALLTGEYPPQPGGIGDYTAELGAALLARGHDVLVFTIADGRFQIVDLARARTGLQSPSPNRYADWGWSCWGAVRAALARTQPDVLHIQYQTGAYAMHPAINFLPWRLRLLRQRPRVIVTAHDLRLPYLFPKAGPLRGWVTRRLLADADAVVVTNEADFLHVSQERSNVLELIPIGSNIAVAPPPGYDRAAWRARLGAADDTIVVAYFGLISYTKGLDVLLDALVRLPVNIRLLVVGGAASATADRAYAERIQQQIAAQGLASRVTSAGHCPADQVSGYLLAADMAALPFSDGASFRRGSLLAVLAHGLPTVTTLPPETSIENQEPTNGNLLLGSRFSVPRLEDGKDFLLVPPSDAQALAGAIARLAQAADLRARLASSGRTLARQFAWPAIAERHEALYSQILDRQRDTQSAEI